ncbi:MAG: hypothetical protein ACR2HG_09010 [Pyrinomonadaceae bacterium]
MKLNENIFAICRSNTKTACILFTGGFLLILMTTAIYSQSTYSDMWIDDSNLDEDGNGQAFMVGRGVSEINYVDEDGVEVETTITSPNGRTTMSGAFGEVSAQADARLLIDFNDIGEFSIGVERFAMCNNGYDGGGDDGILIRHGVNSAGGLWWRPAGYRRCPRNSYIANSLGFIGTYAQGFRFIEIVGEGYYEYGLSCIGTCSQQKRYQHFSSYKGPYLQCNGIYFVIFGNRICIAPCSRSETEPYCT